MRCPKCGNTNIQLTANTSGQIKSRGMFSTLFHIIMTIITFGLWLIVPILSGGSTGKIKTTIMGTCLNCGYTNSKNKFIYNELKDNKNTIPSNRKVIKRKDNSINHVSFYQKQWFLWFTLICLTPLGIFILYCYHDKYSKKTKLFMSIGFALWFIIFTSYNNFGQTKNDSNSNTNDSVEVIDKDKNTAEEILQTTIIINDGELGKYGKIVTIDSNDYIHYKIPTGNYTVSYLDTSTARGGVLYVDKDVAKINSEGYTESVNVMKVAFNMNGYDASDKEITVSSDEHIFVTMNSNFRLTLNK